MKNFCKDLTKIINSEKKNIHHLTIEEDQLYCEQNVCYICKKEFGAYNDDKYRKVRGYCYDTSKYKGAAHNSYNLRYKTQKEIPVVFCNRSKYDYHFIIKELAEEFKGKSKCLGENTE